MKKKKRVKFKNRFQKFYHLNKDRINKKRRKAYKLKDKKGTCVRCKKKSLKGITFCTYHRKKQQEYNRNRSR
ncbi:MAG: hypothetical protein ABIJ21_02450 [Nanoarchaeota archaeon]